MIQKHPSPKHPIHPTHPGSDYTKYDTLGRISEVGQVSNLTANGAITDAITRKSGMLNAWLTSLTNRRSQITSTIYDMAYTGLATGSRG